MWLHRRSKEPSPTSVVCYWMKAKLSTVGSTMKFVYATDLATPSNNEPDVGNFLSAVVDAGKEAGVNNLLSHFTPSTAMDMLSLHNLTYWFFLTGDTGYKKFEEFCFSKMSHEACIEAVDVTSSQAEFALWKKLRFGRITALRIHEAHDKWCFS